MYLDKTNSKNSFWLLSNDLNIFNCALATLSSLEIGLIANEIYSKTSKISLFSAFINCCSVFNSFSPYPASASLSNKAFLVIGFDQILRSSSSFLKNSGNFPNIFFKNSSAEMGLPLELQNDV